MVVELNCLFCVMVLEYLNYRTRLIGNSNFSSSYKY